MPKEAFLSTVYMWKACLEVVLILCLEHGQTQLLIPTIGFIFVGLFIKNKFGHRLYYLFTQHLPTNFNLYLSLLVRHFSTASTGPNMTTTIN